MAWIEEPPSDKVSKFDRLLRSQSSSSSLTSTRVGIARVCAAGRRAHRTRAGCCFAVSQRRGAALTTEVAVKQAPPAQEQRGVPGLSVKTADGVIDVTNTTDGRVAAPDAAGKS